MRPDGNATARPESIAQLEKRGPQETQPRVLIARNRTLFRSFAAAAPFLRLLFAL